jgi:hypothetical protein
MARGGKREGAGRKPIYENQPTVWCNLPLPADWASTWGPADRLRERLLRYLRKTTRAARAWDRPGSVGPVAEVPEEVTP